MSGKPKIEFAEEYTNPLLNGEGSEIAVFIGKTNNESPTTLTDDNLLKFTKYDKAAKATNAGGLGVEPEDISTNPLLNAVKDFFIESAKTETADTGSPYVYAIDLGSAPTTELFTKACELTFKKKEITAMAFVVDTDIALMTSIAAYLAEIHKKGQLRIAYFQAEATSTDADLIKLTDTTQTNHINNSRICIVENKYFGRTVARICLTPYYEEPGYNYYRSITPVATAVTGDDTFNERDDPVEDSLCEAGIIYNHDEEVVDPIRPCIALATSTAYALDDERPNDALLHARRNADHQLRELTKIIGLQLKRNETEVNLRYVKSDCESYLETEVKNKKLQSQYEVKVVESTSNPYSLYFTAKVVPVNSTQYIEVTGYVGAPNAKIVDEI